MITILQLCEHFGGREASLHGVARAFQWWLPLFDKSRFRVLLCSRKAYDKAAQEMINSGLSPLYLGYHKMDPRNLLKLIRLIKKEQVDIIHAHGYGACLWGRLAGLILRKPVIVHERCNYRTVPFYQRPIERLLGPRTAYALAVSASSRDFLVQKRYVPAAVTQVLYNGILLDKLPRVTTEWCAEFRRQEGVSAGQKVAGIVGRLESHKGHIDALLALKEVLRTEAQAVLWIIGDGSYEQVLREKVAELGLTSAVRFLGYRADVLQVIQALDLQIFPSHQEGTPNTLYEAMAVGPAIVASTADGQGEILEAGKTALLFQPGDWRELAGLWLRALQDAGLRERLRANAREKIKEFDGHRCVEAMEALYSKIMAR